MKKGFASTDNHKSFVAATKYIQTAPHGVPKMALVYGPPGLGKSESAIRYALEYGSGAIYIRTKKLQTAGWLLWELLNESGQTPGYRNKDNFHTIAQEWPGSNRFIILDEVDYLANDSKVIETIRDIHDITGVPFVFIGMEQADKKLKRFPHLWRRFSQVIQFNPLGKSDVEGVLSQICEIGIDDLIVDHICSSGEITVAELYKWAMKIELVGKRTGKAAITIEDMGTGKKK